MNHGNYKVKNFLGMDWGRRLQFPIRHTWHTTSQQKGHVVSSYSSAVMLFPSLKSISFPLFRSQGTHLWIKRQQLNYYSDRRRRAWQKKNWNKSNIFNRKKCALGEPMPGNSFSKKCAFVFHTQWWMQHKTLLHN